LGLSLAWLSSGYLPISARIRQRIHIASPLLMLIGCLFTRWIHNGSYSFLGREYFYKFYYAELDVAFIVCFAFGLVFTIHLLREPRRQLRVTGLCFAAAYACLLGVALWFIQGVYRGTFL
jgi:hypothetical protein